MLFLPAVLQLATVGETFACEGLVDNTGGEATVADSCADLNTTDDAGSAPAGNQPSANVGNPISLATGNKYQKETDYQSAHSKLQLNRHYNSLNNQYNLGYGQGWTNTFSVRLVSSGDQRIDVIQSNGRRLKFKAVGTQNDRVVYRTAEVTDGYLLDGEAYRTWHLTDGRTLKFRGPFLVHIDYPGHESLSLYYKNAKLFEVSDQNGRVIRLKYASGKVGLTHFDQQGQQTIPGHLEVLTLPDGSDIHYRYDSSRNLTEVVYPDQTSRQYHYEDSDFPNSLTGVTDRNGVRFATWSYDNKGRAISSSHANDVEKVSLEFVESDETESGFGTTVVTNSLGQKSEYQWKIDEKAGQVALLGGTGAGCVSCPELHQYSYTVDNQVEQVTIKGDNSRRYEYDDVGRLARVFSTGADGVESLISEREYEGNSFKPSKVIDTSVNPEEPMVRSTVYTLDGLPLEVTESGFAPVNSEASVFEKIERTVRFSYQSGRLESVDGPRDDVEDITRFSYDRLGRLHKVHRPNGRVVTVSEYDSSGRPVEYRSAGESPYRLTWSDHNNIAGIEHLGNRVEYRYDAEGRLTGVVDPDGRFVSVDYDDAGRLIELVDDQQRKMSFDRDSENRHIATDTVDAAGRVIENLRYLYDAEGRLTASNNSSSHSDSVSGNSYQHDSAGRLSGIENPNGDGLALTYNNAGQLFSLVQGDSEGSKTTHLFHYDRKGQDIGYTDGRNNTTLYLKDDFGRIVLHSTPDTGVVQFTYDAAGNRREKKSEDGSTVAYKWDAADRLIEKRDATGITSYEYHPENGRLSKTTNPVTTEQFRYSKESQLIEHSRIIDDREFVTRYSYLPDGKMSTRSLADGTVLQYHYHDAGVNKGTLKAITKRGLLGLSQDLLVGEIDIDKRDGSTGYLSANGIRTQHDYSGNGQIASTELSRTLQLQYRYDESGQIIGIDENDIAQQFRYDQGRLLVADTLTGNFSYRYDAAGNRTSSVATNSTGDKTESRYRYPEQGEGNRLLEILQESGSDQKQELVYDHNTSGSPTTVGTMQFEYDVNQRPVKVYQGKQLLAEYAYNSFGERVRKIAWQGDRKKTTWYLYDGRRLTAEISDDDERYDHYVYVGDYPATLLKGSEAYGIHSDFLGTPRQLTDQNQDTVWQASYEPFGKAHVNTAAFDFNLRFPGQYLDTETETHYNYYRDYDPATGRYVTSDPIGLRGGLNTYAYVNNNPLSQTDPLGLAPDDSKISIDGVVKPVADTTYMERLKFVVLEAGKAAGAEMFAAAQAMVQSDNLRNMALMMGAITALQAFPATAAVVDTILVGWAWWNFGTAGAKFIWDVIKTGVDLISVGSMSRLCSMASTLGSSLANFGQAAFDVIDRFSTKAKNTANSNNITPTSNPTRVDTPAARPPNPPSGYTINANGTITGPGRPNPGVYTPTGFKDLDGYEVYQVGSGGYYVFKDGKAHPVRSPRPRDTENNVTHVVGETKVDVELRDNGWAPLGTTRQSSGNLEDDIAAAMGQNGIDGIYKKEINGETVYIVVETKASVTGTAGSLSTMTGNQTAGQMQLSTDWLRDRIRSQRAELGDDYDGIMAALNTPPGEAGSLVRLKADVTNVVRGETTVTANVASDTITYTQYTPTNSKTVERGTSFDPTQ